MNSEELLKALTQAKTYGFLSPKDIEEQITHAKELFEMLPTRTGKIIDIGAGGGLPSFVFMEQEQSFDFTLLDAMNKRTDFLLTVAEELADNFSVVNGRAEEVSTQAQYANGFDMVVARGFGPPATTAECATNFLKIGGYLFVSGSPENEESRWDLEGLKLLGLKLIEIKYSSNATGVVMQKIAEQDSKYPRRDGVPRKRPLW